MDITKISRELIYRDRTDLDEFGVDDEGTLNHAFFQRISDEKFIKDNNYAEDYVLETFNDAYFIAILFRLDNHPTLHFERYRAIAAKGTVLTRYTDWANRLRATLALVYNIFVSLDYGKSEFEQRVLDWIRNPFNRENLEAEKGIMNNDPNLFLNLCLPEEELKKFTIPLEDVSPRNIDFDNIDIAYVLVSDESMKYTFEAIAKISDPNEKYHAVDSLLNKAETFSSTPHFRSLDEKEDFFKRKENCIEQLQVLKLEIEQGRSNGDIQDELEDLEKKRDSERLRELEVEIEQLKKELEDAKEENKGLIDRFVNSEDIIIKSEKFFVDISTLLTRLLMDCLSNTNSDNEKIMKHFLQDIIGKKDLDVAREFKKVRKIFQFSNGKLISIYRLLHAAGFYDKSLSNFYITTNPER